MEKSNSTGEAGFKMRTIARFLTACLISCAIYFCLMPIVCAQISSAQPQSNKTKSEPLKIKIEHTTMLRSPFVDLKAGESVTRKAPTKGSDDWILLPSWLPGKWRSYSATEIESRDLVSGIDVEANKSLPVGELETFGFQMDSARQIWTPAEYPEPISVFENSSSGSNDSRVYRSLALISAGPARVQFRCTDHVLNLDPKSNKFKSTYSKESICTYVLMAPDLIVKYSDAMTYDASGHQIKQSKISAFCKKEDPFEVVSEVGMRNLKVSLAKYLEHQGMADLARGM